MPANQTADRQIKASIMPEINASGLRDVVQHIMLGANEVPMIWGGFGIGKTSIIGQALAEKGAMICDIRLGQQDTVDMRGFPGVDHNPNSKTFGQTIWYAPSMLPFIGNDQWPDDVPIGLVLDEITSGQTQVLGGAYQLIDERRYGEFTLKPNVYIIAMGNREIDRGIVNRMPMPLLTRMVQYEMIVDVEELAAYALKVGVPRWVIAYWFFKKENVNNYDPDKPEKVVACPRTWFKFAKFAQLNAPETTKFAACQGAIGKGVATEAWAYQDIYMNVPSVKTIIANPKGTPVPSEASMEYAVCIKIAGEMNSKNVTPLYQYLCRMQPSFTILAWTLAGKRDPSLTTTPEFIEFSQRYRDVFSAAA